MSEESTTAVVQRYLDALAGDQAAEPIVRALLDRSVRRLQMLCANLLYRKYRRLTLPPLNLQPDEMLDAVVERLLKPMGSVRPQNVRQFFALVNQHMRWELNDVARRLGVAADESTAQAPILWQRLPADPQGFVDLGALYGNAEHISAYVFLRVYSPEKQQLALLCGSDDFIRVWLNGKQIHEYLRQRSAAPDSDSVLATLEPGWNTLLARVVNVTGKHALYWRLSNDPAEIARAHRKNP